MESNDNNQKHPLQNLLLRGFPERLCKTGCFLSLMILLFFSNGLWAQTITVDGQPADWPAVLNSTNTTIVKSFVHDAFQATGTDNSFTGGSSDVLDIPGWSWVLGNSNDKGDIANAGAALIGSTLYFFGDRAAVNGDAQIGFWFFHDKVAPTGTGASSSPFSGVHKVGDLLLLSNFTNGGGSAKLNIYKWVGTGGDLAGGLLQTVSLGTVGNAFVNTSDQSVPTGVSGWTYTSKKIGSIPTSGTPQLYITGSFFEGSVDLGKINADQCFTSFLLETRQSQSVTASLNDFVAGNFNVTPQVSVNNQTVCPDPPNSATFTATVTAGTGIGPFTYEWKVDGVIQSGVTGNTLTLTDQTATHTITVVAIGSNGCRSLPATGNLSLYTRPTVTASIDTKTGVEFITPCYAIHLQKATTATVRATATGAATITYSWVASNATPGALSYITFTGTSTATPALTIISPTAATVPTPYVFTVTITDGNGCKATSNVCIQPDAACPNFDVKGPLQVCAPSQQVYSTSFTLNTTDYTYTWSLQNNTAGATFVGTSVDVQSVTVNVPGPGNYTVRLTVAYRNGFDVCGFKEAGPVDARQVSCTVTKKSDVSCKSVCDGSATVNPVNGFPPYTYKWDDGETTQTATQLCGSEAGTVHTVTVTDANNCTTTCNVTITEPALLTCTVHLDANTSCKSVCDGKATVTATGGTAPYTYKWDDGETTQQATKLCGSETGLKHTVTVTDNHGCTTTCDVTVTEPALLTCTASLVSNTDCFKNNGSATVTATGGTTPYTYKWDDGETTQTATALSKGLHSVTVTDNHNCTTSCNVTIPENPCVHIFCTNTTCQNFLTTTQVLPQICYNTQNGTITPGVFYYWTSLKAPGTSFSISVLQTNNCGAVPFLLGNGNQFDLPDANCTNAGSVTYSQNATTGTVTVTVSGATAGQTYILGLKYGAKSGATFSSTCTFTFVSQIGGVSVSGSQGVINVVQNCSATCTGTLTTTAARNPSATLSDAVSGLQVHAYPNPFNSTINFNFVSPLSGKASLEVFDLLGRKLAVVYDGTVDANRPRSMTYKVPGAQMVPMIYRLTVGDQSTKGTLLPAKQQP